MSIVESETIEGGGREGKSRGTVRETSSRRVHEEFHVGTSAFVKVSTAEGSENRRTRLYWQPRDECIFFKV